MIILERTCHFVPHRVFSWKLSLFAARMVRIKNKGNNTALTPNRINDAVVESAMKYRTAVAIPEATKSTSDITVSAKSMVVFILRILKEIQH